MINLLYVINFLNHGGPSNVLKNLAFSLDSKKYRITILTLINENDPQVVQEFKKRNIKIVPLELDKSLKSIVKNRKSIIKTINSFHANIIHTHGIVPTFLVASKKIHAKKFTTIHNTIPEDYRYTYGKLKGAFFTKFHIRTLKTFDQVICCSESSYNNLKTKIKNCTFIRNGIDPATPAKNARTKIRRELNLKPTDTVYVYAGNLSPLKGSLELAQIFSKNHAENEYLLLIGDGPAENAIKNLHDTHILLPGRQNHITNYLSASDVYVSNSHTEGLSISIVEALGTGLPLLLRDIPSHRECIDISHAYLGETFTPKTFNSQASKLHANLKHFHPDTVPLIQKAHFSAQSMAKGYARLYQNSTVKFSIIIPAYNAEKTLSRCIDSILNQSYNNFEIIIVNDGSNDHTWPLCKEYARKDSRIRIIKHQNHGVSHARNTGIKKATGDYIIFVDADDRLLQNALTTLITVLTKHHYDVIRYNYTGGTMSNLGSKTFSKSDIKKLLPYFLGNQGDLPCYSWLLCIKKSSTLQYDESITHYEDIEYMTRLLLHINSIHFLDQPLYKYTYSPSGITKDPQKALANIKHIQHSYQKTKQLLTKNHLLPKTLSQQIDANIFHLTVDKLQLCRNVKSLSEIFSSPVYANINPALLTPKLRLFHQLITKKHFTAANFLLYLSRIKGAFK